MHFTQLYIFLLQDTSPAASGASEWSAYVAIATAILTTLGVREIIAKVLSRKKESAETMGLAAVADATRSKADSDAETAAVSNVDKAVDRVVQVVQQLSEMSDTTSRIRVERDKLKAKEHFWTLDKAQMEAALRNASDKIAKQDELIVELRKQLNDERKSN